MHKIDANKIKLELLKRINEVQKVEDEYKKMFEETDATDQTKLRRLDLAITKQYEYRRGLEYALKLIEEAQK